MAQSKRRKMKPSEIPDFVAEIIKTGCDITAIGHDKYVLGDIEEQDAAIDELDRIGEKYGDRDHLKLQIVAYLWSIDRYIELEPEVTRH
ncbi:hypothetical protein B9J07_13155 [Sinorhizobium sp. LM21]|uniref:hypothetical protein n=1 Tax=Sinorhizobium phage phiLM21 TaxID=1524882 RepID=UPI0004E5D331|nr:hypothetical protein AWJ26_gp40 [Sinorhizobium phage phiLM21]AII27820.1 hypothetical protein phiLM21_p069 [Sinorhizobium phage phiLM21]OWZ93581.1 hypothetical protein B9J07_13155 [Sinorhizobium sp. LM21]